MDDVGIALFAYNRVSHVKRVLDGLRENGARKIYVFSDAAKSAEESCAVDAVRKLIREISWCEVKLIAQESNLGLDASIHFGIKYVLERHERIIVLEDDCVPMPSFLRYMHDSLDRYADEKKVMHIDACSPPFLMPKSNLDALFCQRVWSWGWGTWRDRWNLYMPIQGIDSILEKDGCGVNKINAVGLDLLPMLSVIRSGIDDNWDVQWAITVILLDGLCLSPRESHINLIGHDGSGMHCGSTDFFSPKAVCNGLMNEFHLPDELSLHADLCRKFYHFSYGRKGGVISHQYLRITRFIKSVLGGILDARKT